jgi:hypothetical protein
MAGKKKTHGGSRPGAGRKPGSRKREKNVNYNARISEETLARLKAEAEKRPDKSVSALAAHLIKHGLDDMSASYDAPTRALCFLIGDMAGGVSNIGPGGIIPWRFDPFLYETLKLSIGKLMDLLRPPGEIVTPSDPRPLLHQAIYGSIESPEARAEWLVSMTMQHLFGAKPGLLTIPEGFTTEAAKLAQDHSYNIFKAKRDLGYETYDLNDLNKETSK